VFTNPSDLLLRACALLIGWTSMATAWALPDDRRQPMHIESDSASRDDRSRITIYVGNVQIDQGSMHVAADKVTVHMASGSKVDRIVAEGKPATYRQLPEVDGKLVVAHAMEIEYNVAKDLLVLKRSAQVEQDGSSLEGELVTYDIAKDRMQARGGEGDGRVRMVIPPEPQPTDH
jgi:lipopolysaccharide export system protein LptA